MHHVVDDDVVYNEEERVHVLIGDESHSEDSHHSSDHELEQ